MINTLLRSATGTMLLTASALACASQPVELTEAQLDTVSAGSVAAPQASQFASVGAMSYSLSNLTSTPGATSYIGATFNLHAGTSGSGALFTPHFWIVPTIPVPVSPATPIAS